MQKPMGWLLGGGLLIAVLLLLGLYLQGEIDAPNLLYCGGGAAVFLAALGALLGLALRPQTSWGLADDGLECLGPSGKWETIRWERIKSMQCKGPSLLVIWEVEGVPWPTNRYNRDRAVLWVGRERAAELVSIWIEKRRASGAEHRAPPHGGPATPLGNSGVAQGPPSVT